MYRVCLSPPYISLWKHPAMLRDMAGREGNALICFLCCGYFLTPPSLVTPPLYFAMQNTGEEVNTLRCIVFVFLPYISLRKHPVMLRDAAREAGNFLLCEFSRAALFFCLIEKPDIKDYRLYRSISSMMSRRLYSRGILCCPPSLLWSRNQASNIPVLAGMISRHSSAILLNRLAS